MAVAFFEDEHFQDCLVYLLIHDLPTLKSCGLYLTVEDFKPRPGMRHAYARWLTAERCLTYYKKHHEPIGKLLRSDVLEFIHESAIGPRQRKECEDYLLHLKTIKTGPAEGITSKVVRWKQEILQAEVLDHLSDLQAAGQLTTEAWMEATQKILAIRDGEVTEISYFGTLQQRLERRALGRRRLYAPQFLIDPLDNMVKGVGLGQLGLVLAPYGRGKSMMLEGLSLNFCLQGLHVGLFTLEDPMCEVEDRLDSAVSHLESERLSEMPKILRSRFQRYMRQIRSHLHIFDGTESGLSVAQIEQLATRYEESGKPIDAFLIDYDDEIVPAVRHKERRMEFADIYRDLRRMGAKRNKIVWTAAQTQRGTEHMKILSGDRVAEDISKLRKVTMCVSMGQGEWGPESLYLWVAKHKFDRQYVGCHIIPDKSRMLIYDRAKTLEAQAEFEGPSAEDLEEVGAAL